MARTDIIVLGAGIVGTSVALHLAKRGLSVALVDRGGPGEGTSYGNAGIIEGNTMFPAAFPSDLARAPAHRAQALAGGQLSSGVSAAGRALACWRSAPPRSRSAWSRPRRRCGRCWRARSAEHEALSAEAGAERYLRRTGWLKLYRSDRAFAGARARARARGGARHRQCAARCAMRRARSSRRSRRCFATPCIGPAR